MKKSIFASDLVCVDTRIKRLCQGKACIRLSLSGKGLGVVADIDISLETARGLMDDLQRDLEVIELENIREELKEELANDVKECLLRSIIPNSQN